MAKNRQIYAVYRGEDNLGDGTAEQLAQRFGISAKTIRMKSTPAAHRRNKGTAFIVVKLGKEKTE